MTTQTPLTASTSLLRRLWRRTDGNVSLLAAVLGLPMILAVGVGVDVGRAIDMRTALQADVDAAALSGAAAAFGTSTQTSSGTDTPSAVGQSFYTDAGIPLNAGKTAASTAISVSGTAPNAVTVTATATAQIRSIFLGLWQKQIPVGASAKAIVGSPGSASSAFPFALPSCVLNKYWDSTTQSPIPNPDGTPQIIKLNSQQQPAGGAANCTFGQWTSLNVNNNSASFIDGIINNGCQCVIDTSTGVYIQPGKKSSLYGDTSSLVGQTVLMAVVTTPDLTVSQFSPVVGFAPFVITAVHQGSPDEIDGHFTSNFRHGGLGSPGSGAVFGAITVALVQ